MRRFRVWAIRFGGLLWGSRRQREFAEEIDAHIQMHIDDKVRAGMPREEARRDAILALGGLESTKERYRDRTTLPVLEHLVQDTRFAIRQLASHPGFTVTAVLVLALGMGAAVAIFGFVNAALIRPLPYEDPARLAHVTGSVASIPRAALSYLDYLDWKRDNRVFKSVEVFRGTGFLLKTPSGTDPVPAARVSAGFFRTLGIRPLLGRDFYTGTELPVDPHAVMLTYQAWQQRFGGREDVIGRAVTLDGAPHTIVGVLPQHFHFAPQGRAEIWATVHATGPCEARRSCHNLEGVGRLEDGVSLDTAREHMQSIAARLERQYPDSNRGQGASVLPLSEVIVGDIRPVLLVMLGGAGLLLLIACANVAGLLLVRTESRRRELAVRSALGASTGRLVCQFVTEGLVLVMAGSALGLVCASWAMQLLPGLIPADMAASLPYLRDVGLNRRVVGCAGLLALIASGLFAITPIMRISTAGTSDGLADGGRGASGGVWQRLGSRLVVLELATAMVLLAGAGLLSRSLHQLLNVELGFNPDRVATIGVAAPQATYGEGERALALGRRVVSRVARLPAVESVALTSLVPVTFNGNTDWIRFVGRPYNGEHNEVNMREVSADYFTTLRAALLRGRSFTDADDLTKPRVVIINRRLAALYFPAEDPIGKRIGDTSLSPDSIKEIIGVVDDIREGPLDSEIWPAVYYPFNQSPGTNFSVVVRTSPGHASILPALSTAIREIDPDIAAMDGTTMDTYIHDSRRAYLHRSSTWLVGSFAAVALLLGVIGLYGVVAYSVAQRTREIGVRMALGARTASVYRLVVGEAGRLAAIGIAAGLACAVGAASLMRELLFGTPPWDPLTLAVVAALLGGAALASSYFPARRAASVNPMDALRTE